jgi:hypothetical protein
MDRDSAANVSAVCRDVPYDNRAVADLARQAKPRLLIIYQYPIPPDDMLADMSARYAGEFVVGRDLDIY